ncbi:Probable polyol transporter 4 [Linum perenne]
MVTLLQAIKVRSLKPTLGAVWITFLFSFPFFLSGYYEVAVLNSAVSIQGDLDLTSTQLHVLVEVMSRLPTVAGAWVAGVAANFYGRTYTTACGTGLYTIGVLIVSSVRSYAACMLGHSVAGFGIGMGLVMGPIYIAEIAPANVRGFLGYFPQVNY